jgi:hypothetical protein
VALGPANGVGVVPLATMPRLIGFAPQDAGHVLALFSLRGRVRLVSNVRGLRRVVAQFPAPGQRVPRRGIVRLSVGGSAARKTATGILAGCLHVAGGPPFVHRRPKRRGICDGARLAKGRGHGQLTQSRGADDNDPGRAFQCPPQARNLSRRRKNFGGLPCNASRCPR